MVKLKQQAKKIGRSAYGRLPWHTKLLIPVMVAGLIAFLLGELAGLIS